MDPQTLKNTLDLIIHSDFGKQSAADSILEAFNAKDKQIDDMITSFNDVVETEMSLRFESIINQEIAAINSRKAQIIERDGFVSAFMDWEFEFKLELLNDMLKRHIK